MLVATDIPNPESVRHIPELAWHAWQAGIQDPEDCVIQCWDLHGANVHTAILSEENGLSELQGGDHTYYAAGTCEDKHPLCEPTQDMLVAIDDAIQTGDAARLRSILDEDEGASAYIAWERSAIQVLDCSESGELLAHLPVPSELLRAAVQD